MRLTKVAAVAAVLTFAGFAFAGPAAAELANATDPLPAPSGTYIMDRNHASLHFKVSHMGLSNYTARFTGMNATLVLDSEKPENSTLVVEVDPLSLRTDFPNPEVKDFDKELTMEPAWLDAGSYPEIVFTSKKMTRTGPNSGTVEGDLTFRGVTKPVTLDVTLNGAMAKHPFVDAGALGISATGTIKRSDFGMANMVPAIGDEVDIIIEAEFIQQK